MYFIEENLQLSVLVMPAVSCCPFLRLDYDFDVQCVIKRGAVRKSLPV